MNANKMDFVEKIIDEGISETEANEILDLLISISERIIAKDEDKEVIVENGEPGQGNYTQIRTRFERLPFNEPNEYEWLMSQAIERLKRLLANNLVFTNHKETEQIKNEYLYLSNPLVGFLNENWNKTYGNKDYISKFEFNKKFQDWCEQKKFNPPSSKKLNETMRELRFNEGQKGDKKYRSWLGIRWKGGLTNVDE